MDREVLQHNDSLSYTWNVNPTTLLTASAGYIRSREFQTSNLVGKENLTLNAGIQGFQTEGRAQAIGLPDVSFTGYTGFATPWGVPDFQKIWNENYKVNMNLIRGAHSISYGYEFQDGAQSIIIASCCSRGNFGFSGQYTGDGFADYLLGLTSSSLRNFPIEAFGAANAPYSGLYVQDFWKLGPKLTVNLGMRYDYWHERAFVRGTGSTFDLKLGKAVAGENEQRQVDLTVDFGHGGRAPDRSLCGSRYSDSPPGHCLASPEFKRSGDSGGLRNISQHIHRQRKLILYRWSPLLDV